MKPTCRGVPSLLKIPEGNLHLSTTSHLVKRGVADVLSERYLPLDVIWNSHLIFSRQNSTELLVHTGLPSLESPPSFSSNGRQMQQNVNTTKGVFFNTYHLEVKETQLLISLIKPHWLVCPYLAQLPSMTGMDIGMVKTLLKWSTLHLNPLCH